MPTALEAPRLQNPGILYVTPHHLAVLAERNQSGLADFLRLFLSPGKVVRLHGPDEDSPPQDKAVLSVRRGIKAGLSDASLNALLTALCPPTGEMPGDAIRKQHEIRAQLARGDMVALQYSS